MEEKQEQGRKMFGIEFDPQIDEPCPLCGSIMKAEWISVQDRLPEKTGRYIVHQWRTGETSDCDYFHPEDPDVYSSGWEYEQEKISHWMPMPEPPRTEQ